MRRCWLPGLILLTAACGGRPALEPIPDDRLGLVEADVLEIPEPAPVRFEEASPGEGSPPARVSADSPPVVPHAVADFLPITRDENYCIECHAVAEKVEGEPTPIPQSHYTDLRNAPERPGDSVAGARWNCTACHVSRTGAEPLVTNSFGN